MNAETLNEKTDEQGNTAMIITIDVDPNETIEHKFIRHLFMTGMNEFIITDSITRNYIIRDFHAEPPVDNKQQIEITNPDLFEEFEKFQAKEASDAEKQAMEAAKKAAVLAELQREKDREEAERIAAENAEKQGVEEIIEVNNKTSAALVKNFKQSNHFKRHDIPLDSNGDIPGLKLSANKSLVFISGEHTALLTKEFKTYKAKTEQIEQKMKMIYDILWELYTQVGQVDNHKWSKAYEKAHQLVQQLSTAANTYEQQLFEHLHDPERPAPNISSQLFKEAYTKAIVDAMPILQKDLGWGDYLKNMLKELSNHILTYCRRSNLFALKKSDSAKTLSDANFQLRNDTDDDIPDYEPESPR